MRRPELIPSDVVSIVASRVVKVVERTAFWIAVALPVGYLPVLVWTSPAERVPMLVGLVGLHGVMLVVGHHYEPPDENGYDASTEVSPDG